MDSARRGGRRSPRHICRVFPSAGWSAILVLASLPWSLPWLRAAALPFSHEFHLKTVGTQCVDCHSGALASRAASDSNLPTEADCMKCHDLPGSTPIDRAALRALKSGALKSTALKSEKRTYRFDHQFHLKLGNLAPVIAAAVDGGGYLGPAGDIRRHLDTQDSCQACHRGLAETARASKEHLPRMADCLVCHSEIDNPFSCERCHLPGAELRPAGHSRNFVDLHSTGKISLDKQSCLPCHGRNFACMGCH